MGRKQVGRLHPPCFCPPSPRLSLSLSLLVQPHQHFIIKSFSSSLSGVIVIIITAVITSNFLAPHRGMRASSLAYEARLSPISTLGTAWLSPAPTSSFPTTPSWSSLWGLALTLRDASFIQILRPKPRHPGDSMPPRDSGGHGAWCCTLKPSVPGALLPGASSAPGWACTEECGRVSHQAGDDNFPRILL